MTRSNSMNISDMNARCAEKMGLRLIPTNLLTLPPKAPCYCAVRVSPGRKAAFWYCVAHNDAHAMALLKKFPSQTLEELTLLVQDCRDKGEEPTSLMYNVAIAKCVVGLS